MLLQFIIERRLPRAFVLLAQWWCQSLELSCCGLSPHNISLTTLSSQGLSFIHLNLGHKQFLRCLSVSVILGAPICSHLNA